MKISSVVLDNIHWRISEANDKEYVKLGSTWRNNAYYVLVTCSECNDPCLEHKKTATANIKHFCSRHCSILYMNKHLTAEQIQIKASKIRKAHIGRKCSPEQRLRMSQAQLAHPHLWTDEERANISAKMIGNKFNIGKNCGSKHWNWKGGISKLDIRGYRLLSGEYKRWVRDQKIRRGGRCENCGYSHNVHLHHIIQVHEDSSLIEHPDNVIILCKKCHNIVHSKDDGTKYTLFMMTFEPQITRLNLALTSETITGVNIIIPRA